MSRSLTGGRPAREKEINEIRKSTDCTTGKMIFTKLRDKNVALLVNSGGIAAVRVLRSNASKLGGIYLGKIQNVAKNIDACFVEIAPGELCFLPLREAGTAHLTNRQPDGSLKAGDELVVMVTRDAQKTKRASVTTDPSRMKQQLVKNGVTPESASKALQILLNQAIHKVCLTCLLAPSEAIYEALEQLADPSEYSEVLTDDPEIFHKLSESSHPLLQQKNLRLYDDPAISLRLLYSLERGMDEALDTRVWLKCGGLSGQCRSCRRGCKTVASAESVRYHYRRLHQYGRKGKSSGTAEIPENADHTGSSASPDRGYDTTWSGGNHP